MIEMRREVMSEVRELPLTREVRSEVRELIDAELDAVCGGIFDFGNLVIAPNIGLQVGVA